MAATQRTIDKHKYSEEIQRNLLAIAMYFDDEDRAVRERQIRLWKKLKYYWEGYQRIWWSETAHDWRIWDAESSDTDDQTNNSYYDKPVNIFKAYGESIAAALSIKIPGIKAYPDDADNPMDLLTAKAGDKISELFDRHNDVSIQWLHALYVLITEGMVAAYTYVKEDEKYGTYQEPKFGKEEIEAYICPSCGEQLADEVLSGELKNSFMPDDNDVELHDLLINEGIAVCPFCAEQLDPNLQKTKLTIPRFIGMTSSPKSRICLEVHGGLFVKVANYAQKQSDTPYLIYAYETNYVNVLERYDYLRNVIKANDNSTGTSAGSGNAVEVWGRLSTQYLSQFPTDNVTVRNVWLRPQAFNILPEEDCKELKKLFPDGCKVVIVNETFADACNEDLDDCWTLTYNPFGDYIHTQPLGQNTTPIQDITNDLVSLVLQTIEHGIPQTFADPQVLNFDQYGQLETSPGAIYPAKPKSGGKVSDAFYEVKTSLLSGEVLPFYSKVEQAGQLVSGALPSLFGGTSDSGSKTAAEYDMSRKQAQQRLQVQWQILCVWWKQIKGKVIPAYMKELQEDERFVTKDRQGNFLNSYIRIAELEGKIGSVELEPSDQLPITWTQKKDSILGILQLANPMITEAIFDPENIPLVKEALGLQDFDIPGAEDRDKQYDEIKVLVNSEPIMLPGGIDPVSMQEIPEQEMPSVEIEPEIDNNDIHIYICRKWLVGPIGRLCKIENEAGYKNVLLHLRMHIQEQQMQAMAAAEQQDASQEKNNNDSVENKEKVNA